MVVYVVVIIRHPSWRVYVLSLDFSKLLNKVQKYREESTLIILSSRFMVVLMCSPPGKSTLSLVWHNLNGYLRARWTVSPTWRWQSFTLCCSLGFCSRWTPSTTMRSVNLSLNAIDSGECWDFSQQHLTVKYATQERLAGVSPSLLIPALFCSWVSRRRAQYSLCLLHASREWCWCTPYMTSLCER